MSKPYLCILCGLPFSGKTTLAKELVKKYDWVRVDLDQINSERELGGLANVDKALAQEKTVINDTANFTREQRDKLRLIAKKYNIPSKVIYINIPEDEARRRWQENRISKIRYDVKDEDFAEVADNFQPPAEDENVVYYDQAIPLEVWINKYL